MMNDGEMEVYVHEYEISVITNVPIEEHRVQNVFDVLDYDDDFALQGVEYRVDNNTISGRATCVVRGRIHSYGPWTSFEVSPDASSDEVRQVVSDLIRYLKKQEEQENQ